MLLQYDTETEEAKKKPYMMRWIQFFRKYKYEPMGKLVDKRN